MMNRMQYTESWELRIQTPSSFHFNHSHLYHSFTYISTANVEYWSLIAFNCKCQSTASVNYWFYCCLLLMLIIDNWLHLIGHVICSLISDIHNKSYRWSISYVWRKVEGSIFERVGTSGVQIEVHFIEVQLKYISYKCHSCIWSCFVSM